MKGKEAIHFIWLQRYISDVLDIERPEWRNDENDSLTVYIPAHNNFIDNFEKVEKIAHRIKYIEELSEFSEKYSDITMALQTIIDLQDMFENFDYVIKNLKRLTQLTTLLSKNNCCIDKKCILELIEYLNGVKDGSNNPKEMEDYPHNFNLELLRTSNLSTRFVEEMEADNEGNTTY